MNWSINHDVTHHISTSDESIDTESPIRPGESVLLRNGVYEFKVLVDASEGELLNGTVLSIGPTPTTKAQGISRGQKITFNKMNVFCVYRVSGVAE